MELIIPLFMSALLGLTGWGVYTVMKKHPNMGIGAALNLFITTHHFNYISIASILFFVTEGFVGATAESDRAEINEVVRAVVHTLILSVGIVSVYGTSNFMRVAVGIFKDDSESNWKMIPAVIAAVFSACTAVYMPYLNMLITAQAIGQMQDFYMVKQYFLLDTESYEALRDYYGYEYDYNPVERQHSALFIQECLFLVHMGLSIMQVIWSYTIKDSKEFNRAAGVPMTEIERKQAERAAAKKNDDPLKTPVDPSKGPRTAGEEDKDKVNDPAKANTAATTSTQDDWKRYPDFNPLESFLKNCTGKMYDENKFLKRAVEVLKIVERQNDGAATVTAIKAKIFSFNLQFEEAAKKLKDKVFTEDRYEEEMNRIAKEAKLFIQKGVSAQGEKGLGFTIAERKK